jgi:hypothetical protein
MTGLALAEEYALGSHRIVPALYDGIMAENSAGTALKARKVAEGELAIDQLVALGRACQNELHDLSLIFALLVNINMRILFISMI